MDLVELERINNLEKTLQRKFTMPNALNLLNEIQYYFDRYPGEKEKNEKLSRELDCLYEYASGRIPNLKELKTILSG